MLSCDEVCPFSVKTVSDWFSWYDYSTCSGICPLFTGYYPADFIDLWPALMLQKHHYCDELLLIMPIAAMHSCSPAHTDLEQQIVRFLDTNSIDPKGDLYRWTWQYGYSIKRIVPLDPVTDATNRNCLDLQHLGRFGAVYMQVSHSRHADVHLLILEADPSECWHIQEELERPVDILIESGKGMGNWFTGVPLYKYIAMGPEGRIPRYYMKGKYMSYAGPKGTSPECSEYDSLGCGIATEIRRVDPAAFKSGYLFWNRR